MNKHRINSLKKLVLKLLLQGYINKFDIEDLNNKTLSDIINNYDKENFKIIILSQIYLNPYLLCNDDMLNNKLVLDIEQISNLLIKRYNEEIIEYNYQLQEGFISQDQYNNMTIDLQDLYFLSSKIGTRIYHISDQEIIKQKVMK